MDYLTLGLGSLTSIVTAVDVAAWGRTLMLACVYNPGGEDRPSRITFHGCSQIRWEALGEEQGSGDAAELLGIELGAPQHQRPALINTDAFELVVWYDHHEVQK